MCYLKIEGDIIRGNEKTIITALKKIKKEDKASYRKVCKYVDRISERYCFATDWHLDNSQYQKEAAGPGCYARGSKTIYLKPEKQANKSIEETRQANIIKFSGHSRNYWNK